VLAVSPGFTAQAADTAAVGGCLLRSCQAQLAQCLGDSNCLQDLICIQRCQGQPDEKACEIRQGSQPSSACAGTLACPSLAPSEQGPKGKQFNVQNCVIMCCVESSHDRSVRFKGLFWYLFLACIRLFPVQSQSSSDLSPMLLLLCCTS
jgi:VDE lipocalin domain